MAKQLCDRVGMGWRPDLAAGIMSYQDEIDLVEVIAEDYFDSPAHVVGGVATLAKQIPLMVHGVGMGLASRAAVHHKYFERMARLVNRIEPEAWSEHLAFVRVGDREIGHLAAPPRTPANVDGTVENLRRAAEIVGTQPHVENIATLLDPPGSTLAESDWTRRILDGAQCELLFDLHNVFANGLNHGYEPTEFLRAIGAERIRYMHIAGGKMVAAPDGTTRLLDDHLHDVPDPVYDLLEEVAATTPHPLTVILERDGDFPSMETLLQQTRRARSAMARGRARNKARLETAA
ncbi:MAG TPA: DUF692 domain-containing protein [Candidatus Acidoferrum sp.]|nr:DUF692 domain-containing protein [Candidatus Acidoferrum sp.]